MREKAFCCTWFFLIFCAQVGLLLSFLHLTPSSLFSPSHFPSSVLPPFLPFLILPSLTSTLLKISSPPRFLPPVLLLTHFSPSTTPSHHHHHHSSSSYLSVSHYPDNNSKTEGCSRSQIIPVLPPAFVNRAAFLTSTT